MQNGSKSRSLKTLTPTEKKLAERLKNDVFRLADDIGERNVHLAGTMEKTAGWIEDQMKEAGFQPKRHSYETEGLFHAGFRSDNLIADIPGVKNPENITVIGAHYDTVSGSPGANDNASAVAVLLALADCFADRPQPETFQSSRPKNQFNFARQKGFNTHH